MSVKCGHCRNHHDTVRDVRQCAMSDGVSAGKIAEQNGLISQRPVWTERAPGESPAMAAGRLAAARSNGYVSPEQAEARRVAEHANLVNEQNGHVPAEYGQGGQGEFRVSSEEKRAARERMFGGKTEAPARREKTRAAEGMYRKSGTIYKVQKAVHGSGQLYAKRLVETLTVDRKGNRKWRFEYAPGFVFELRPEHALTLDQAKEFGALYGSCCVCGKTLTDENSIAAGIGPVCASKF